MKKRIPVLLLKCLKYFAGTDRSLTGWEGLAAAQACLLTDDMKDSFEADYRVLNRAWNFVSPDKFLSPYKEDYRWLSQVYDSLRPSDGNGALIWCELGAKTAEIIHENIDVEDVKTSGELLTIDAENAENLVDKSKKESEKIEIDLTARINTHKGEAMYQKLGEKVEKLKEQLELGLIASKEFLRSMQEIERETDNIDKLKENLTELFYNAESQTESERIISDIGERVSAVRFDGWQKTAEGARGVKNALLAVIWLKYGIKDKKVIDEAYRYIEEYY